jgi:hypothetical protein
MMDASGSFELAQTVYGLHRGHILVLDRKHAGAKDSKLICAGLDDVSWYKDGTNHAPTIRF